MTETINVKMTGGAPWGFRLQGGGRMSLVVHKIRPKSKSQGVLREGDEIVSVNGINVENMTYDEVMNLVENSNNELNIKFERLTCIEKLPPSEIARQQGTLKRPRKQLSDASSERYERSYKTPDGYHVKETKMYKSSKSYQEENLNKAAPIQCHTKVVKLPEDIIKRSSVVKSPEFKVNREITSPVQNFERKTTIKREYYEKTGSTTKAYNSSVLENNVKDQSTRDSANLSNRSPVVSKKFRQAKQEFFVRPVIQNFSMDNKTNEMLTTLKMEMPSDSEKINELSKMHPKPTANDGHPGEIDKKPDNYDAKEEIKMPKVESDSTDYDTKEEIKTHKVESDFTEPPTAKVENIRTEVEKQASAVKPEVIKRVEKSVESSVSTVKNISYQEVSDGKIFEIAPKESAEKYNGLKETIDTKTEIMHRENNEGTVPNDHVTNESATEPPAASLHSSPQELGPIGGTTMPSLTNQSNSSPSLFKVTKFSSETQSNYSWSPSSQKSTISKNGLTTTTKRHSKIYEGRPIPPLPPPVKPPRPASTPDLENRIVSFAEQLKQEICTPERRNAAEGEDRRSVSLEMIRRALIPPSEEELKETLITKTKKKMFSSSSFYEEPNAIYPTVEEQFDLAQKIANSLSAETNRKSKGADMFIKRVEKSDKWVHQSPSPEIYSSTTEILKRTTSKSHNDGKAMSTTVNSQVYTQTNGSESESELSRQNKLKPVSNPTRPQDSNMFKGTDREFKSEGLALNPAVCANLVQDLNTFKGKGAQIFAKRRKKSEKWIVDDSNVLVSQFRDRSGGKTPPAVPPKPGTKDAPTNRLNSMIRNGSWMQQNIKYVKSPWEAALESPVGNCDAAFEVMTNKYIPALPKAPAEVINARLPSMINLEKSTTPPRIASSTLYKPKVPRGWARSVHDPTSSDLLGCTSDMELEFCGDGNTEFTNWRSSLPSHKYGNYNTLPKSWGRKKKESSSFKPVKASLFSAA